MRPPRCEDEPIQYPVSQEEAGEDPGTEGRDGGKVKYWRVEREEYVIQVVHVQAETKEEAIALAEGKYANYSSWFSNPWVEDKTEVEFEEETE